MQATHQNIGLQSDGHTLSEENQNNSRYSSEEIKGSPFTAVQQEDEWFITWGRWRVSDVLSSREEIDTYMNEQKWNLMCAYQVALLQAARQYDKEGPATPEEKEIEATLQQVDKNILTNQNQ